jgi:hypothetical protein
MELPLRCQCGHLRGAARAVLPFGGFRLVCYCEDCQAFARFLRRADVLDSAGGTDIFQMPPRYVSLTAGTNALRCLRLSNNVLRWYADCCRTPIANTAVNSRFPVVAMIHSVMDHVADGRSRDALLGPPLCRIFEQSAFGPLPSNSAPPSSLPITIRRATKILGWWVCGLGRPNPFFDDRTNTPRSPPQVLTPSERASAYR